MGDTTGGRELRRISKYERTVKFTYSADENAAGAYMPPTAIPTASVHCNPTYDGESWHAKMLRHACIPRHYSAMSQWFSGISRGNIRLPYIPSGIR